MATVGAASIQLFHELKIKYPEVPDDVVSSLMKEVQNISYTTDQLATWYNMCKVTHGILQIIS